MPFQSTLPVKGATPSFLAQFRIFSISIHAPREGSDLFCNNFFGGKYISIHAPREGSDNVGDLVPIDLMISIHAPREGSDPALRLLRLLCHNFNPRSP